MNVGIIISMSSSEAPFIDAILRECALFASPDDTVVSYAQHAYNGDVEDTRYIEECANAHPSVKTVVYEVDVSLPDADRRGVVKRPTAYWHNLARYTAVRALGARVEWVFVIDGDEVPDGARVATWLRQTDFTDDDVSYKIGTHWYFKSPTFQATTVEDSILLIHRRHLTADNIFGDWERDFLVAQSRTRLKRMMMGTDGLPMWHHFSFVRSPANLRKKLASWGHRDDMLQGANIDAAIRHVFHDDGVNDFIHGYEYRRVANRFNIRL